MSGWTEVTVFFGGEPIGEVTEITMSRTRYPWLERMSAQIAAREAFTARWYAYWHWWYVGRGFGGWRFRNGEAFHRALAAMRDATRRTDHLAGIDRRHLPKRARMAVARDVERLRRTQPKGPSVRRCQLDVWRARLGER